MSQKKVDEYKNYKKNRRENIKKEKRKERLTMAAMWGAVVVFIACVGGAMGVSIYNKYQAKHSERRYRRSDTKRDSKRVRRCFIC